MDQEELINPFVLKSAFAEDDIPAYRPQLETNEYKFLLKLCEQNQSREFYPCNIALIGNYGTGKSKTALNLIHDFSEDHKGVGFYIGISGTSAGQIICNIFRDVHHTLFGSRRLMYERSKVKQILGMKFGGAGEVVLSEGFQYKIPNDHLEWFMKQMGFYEAEEIRRGVTEIKKGNKEEIVRDYIQPIHTDFEETFAGIAEYKFYEELKTFEVLLPEEKVIELTSAEKAAYHLGEVFKTLNKPVVFILDELEKIYKLPERKERIKFLDFLRELLDINNRNVFIFCFTRFSFEKLIKEYAALYHRIPYMVSLTNLSRAQLEDFIANRLEVAGISPNGFFMESFIDLLWEITGGNQRSTLFVLDRFFVYLSILDIKRPYNEGDLLTFLGLESEIKDQLLDMLLYDVKERAVSDPKMSNILNILVESYDGRPTTFSELLNNDGCVYEEEPLRDILIKMMEEDIIKASKIKGEMSFIINTDIPRVLGEEGWIKKREEIFN